MTDRIDERVVTTTLLAHEFEQLKRSVVVNLAPDIKNGGTHGAGFDDVPAGHADGRESQFTMVSELSPPSSNRFYFAFQYHSAGIGVDDAELGRQRIVVENYGGFDARMSKTQLIYANIELGVSRASEADQQRQASKYTNHSQRDDKILDRVFRARL